MFAFRKRSGRENSTEVRENGRFREISPVFFVPDFFQKTKDPKSGFPKIAGFEPIQNAVFKQNEKRRSESQDSNLYSIFEGVRKTCLFKKYLQIAVPEKDPDTVMQDLNPNKRVFPLLRSYPKKNHSTDNRIRTSKNKYCTVENNETAFCIHSQMLISRAFGFFICRKDDNR